MKASRVSEWVDDRQRGGRYAFTLPDLAKSIPGSRPSLRQSLLRLQQKNRVRRLRGEFFVILPVEYARIGMIPADWFIEDLMVYLGQSFHVGLFSAAALHGAGHQQVQTYQVMTAQKERSIETAGLKLDFFQKKHLAETPLVKVKGHAGMLPVSSPAATALDLVAWANRLGGLDAIVTPLEELCELMTPDDLASTAQALHNHSIVQRTGWLLDRLGQADLADSLAAAQADHLFSASRVPLDPGAERQGASDNRWRIIVNAQPEGDL